MTMKVLELFSGTGSISKAVKKKNPNNYVISLDRDIHNPHSDLHIQEDIMTWDYTTIDRDSIDLITASPVCMWWSKARLVWIGRKLKSHGDKIITREDIDNDIARYGIPMLLKTIEIIEYFNPTHFWIENPWSSSMKKVLDPIYPKHKVSYCKYGFDYQKDTAFWMDDDLHEKFEPKVCKRDCGKIINNPIGGRCKRGHVGDLGKYGKNGSRLDRYRIPIDLIESLLNCIN